MDILVEHFIKNCNPECEIVSHEIIEHEKFSYTSPRKEIILTIKDKKSGKESKFKYNYNKLLKELVKNESTL